jgi:hypothetical protein
MADKNGGGRNREGREERRPKIVERGKCQTVNIEKIKGLSRADVVCVQSDIRGLI